MKVTLFPCGPAANESEIKAFGLLKKYLSSVTGDDEWLLLTNLAFSVNHQLQSDEIDVVVIGPSGVNVIEIKHWSTQWIDANSDLVEQEADKATNKARKIGTTLRKIIPELPRVDSVLLLTQEPSKMKRQSGKIVRGVRFYLLNELKELLQIDQPNRLNHYQIQSLGRAIEPKSAVAIDGTLKRIAGYVNLELKTPKEERFHRIYKGSHSARQDRVVLHLYDLSASDEKNVEVKAKREFEALRQIQMHEWAPRLLDSYQAAPGYQGEMFFFTVIDPAAPNICERAKDVTWGVSARIVYSRAAVRALVELHDTKTGDDSIVHRNLSPLTMLVKHDNTPILTGFNLARVPSDVSIASSQMPINDCDTTTIAPEIRTQGLVASDYRSDIYSLCASLKTLFNDQDAKGQQSIEVLQSGMAEKPGKRASLNELDSALSKLLGESVASPPPPSARYWSEDQIIRFHDRDYRIIARLGSGGVGTAFKVVEIDRTSREDLGTYVAKAGHNEDTGRRVLKSYSLARSHLGRHPALSAIFEVARDWHENDFVAIMTWIEGYPLSDLIGVFPLLAEEQQEESAEALALRWLKSMCEALDVLHRNGLVHGDVSPRNMIISGSDIVLTDYDFVGKIGSNYSSPGTVLYSSPSYQNNIQASASDDIYALAASFFNVVFEKEPFYYSGAIDKVRGLNWENMVVDHYPILVSFLSKATHSEPTQRFSSVAEALSSLHASKTIDVKEQQDDISIQTCKECTTQIFREGHVEWLHSLLQSYPGSRWGNRETRGLDSYFATQTYVETNIEKSLLRDIRDRTIRLVILCGNAGDGKTALLQHIASKLGFGQHSSSERILEGIIEDGLIVRMNLDGSAAWQGRSADEILDEFLLPFYKGVPDDDIVHLLAINDGRLLEWIERSENTSDSLLAKELSELLENGMSNEGAHIRFINLNQRSLVGGVTPDRKEIETSFLERLIDNLYGGQKAEEIWGPCLSCSALNRCKVVQAARLFGPEGLLGSTPKELRKRARGRLFEALQAIHLRSETHITVRELRSALVYILFGIQYCDDYHGDTDIQPLAYWDRAFAPDAPGRQGEVLRELTLFDPALDAHPQIDRYLMSKHAPDSSRTAPYYRDIPIESARRRAYFEWTPEQIDQIAGNKHALGLARGEHIRIFRNLPLINEEIDIKDLCVRLCGGISRLEDLPPQALARHEGVPLRIMPRTPTETVFWIEKHISSFCLRTDLPSETEGVDRLHRQAHLVYKYRTGQEERLRLGAELFHLLLELYDGYQLGDVSTDDTFAHLSIFVQRLIREDESELLCWNPIKDNAIFKIAANIETVEKTTIQKMILVELENGGR